MSQRTSLDALAREQLKLAAGAGGGRAARTVYGGHEKVLRQTLVAMVGGAELSEHENPGEATVLVLQGRVRLSSGELAWEGSRGDLITVPDARHRLQALEDCAVLLTVAMTEAANPAGTASSASSASTASAAEGRGGG